MRVTIERQAFLRALTHVQSVVERRNTIPILSNVLVQAAKGKVKLSATDLDIEIVVLVQAAKGKVKLSATDLDIEIVETVAADVARDGAATVPAHMLYDIVRKLPDGAQLELDQAADNTRVTITAGKSKFSLQALPAEDFPDLASGEFPHNFNLGADALKTLIEKTRFAISTEETRYYLNGIYMHEAQGNLRAVATDGHRLAQSETPLPEGASGFAGIIVPRKTVLEVVKLLEGVEDDVAISLSAAKMRFNIGELVLTSKLIDGTFPDYERVIPRNNDKVLEIDTKQFSQAVDRVSTISLEKSRAVKMSVGEGRLSLIVNNPDSGSAEEELVVEYDATPIEIGFNARYLLDVASQVKSENMRFELQDSGSPTVVRDAGDKQLLYVLMPMRV